MSIDKSNSIPISSLLVIRRYNKPNGIDRVFFVLEGESCHGTLRRIQFREAYVSISLRTYFLGTLIIRRTRDVTCSRAVAASRVIIHAISIIYLPICVIITSVLLRCSQPVAPSNAFAPASTFLPRFVVKSWSLHD